MLIAINFFLIEHLHISYQLGKVGEFMLSLLPAQNDLYIKWILRLKHALW